MKTKLNSIVKSGSGTRLAFNHLDQYSDSIPDDPIMNTLQHNVNTSIQSDTKVFCNLTQLLFLSCFISYSAAQRYQQT